MDCSPPGSSVHGVLQGRILEWAAMLSSRKKRIVLRQNFYSAKKTLQLSLINHSAFKKKAYSTCAWNMKLSLVSG